MRIALICPSNMLYMPYVSNYEKILQAQEVEYEIINWDRFHIEDNGQLLKYKDSKIGHQRNVLDYLKFSTFVKEKLKSREYNKVIVFGIQVVFFLKSILRNNYKGQYILDIRDYNRIIKFFNIKKVIADSAFTVISSPGYKDWLPQSEKYLVNHNTQISSLEELEETSIDSIVGQVDIANIGAIRDYAINIDFIEALKNSSIFNLYFHGEGNINKDISKYLKTNNIQNVYLTGRYKKEDEMALYRRSDLINLLVPNDNINSRTLLPNRLYNSVLYGKPMLAFEGTYLAEQIKEYELGMIVNSFDDIAQIIKDYLNKFDLTNYQKGRRSFFENVIEENNHYTAKLKEFAGAEA